MKFNELKLETPTVTIYTAHRRLYYGPIAGIPSYIYRMNVVHSVVVHPINNTNVEVA